MKSSSQRVPLTTTIKFKNKEGQVVGEKVVATYAGLLCRAHEEGLRYVRTRILHIPTQENPLVVVLATVRTRRGIFSGLGDATPSNVHAKVAAHYLRVAETRAKSRALRDALDVGTLALDELGGSDDDHVEEPPPPPAAGRAAGTNRPANENGQEGQQQRRGNAGAEPMSEAQSRLLFRLAAERGVPAEQGKSWLEGELGLTDLYTLSRREASQAIDRLRSDPGTNGASSGRTARA